LQQAVVSPLIKVGREKDLDVSVRVVGGGNRGQADAVRHGIARALIRWNEDLKPVLRAEGFLTRDPRAKERKKFGLYKARRAHQWRKR
jgi:small subunit ribosomal protein S9